MSVNENARTSDNQAVPDPQKDEAAITLLRAENERLHEHIRQLEAERDAYRRAAYARALGQITDEELRRYAQDEEGLPLEAFIGELGQIAQLSRDG